MKYSLFVFISILILIFLNLPSVAEEDPLTFCSQNLHNYGQHYNYHYDREDIKEKTTLLVERLKKPNCDLIAVQEVLAENHGKGLKTLQGLAHSLSKEAGRRYEALLGKSNDRIRYLGFLVANDTFSISKFYSYANLTLPEIAPEGKPRSFSRGPFEVTLKLKAPTDKLKEVNAVTFHFKSKHSAGKDPTGLSFEVARLEAAAGMRRAVQHKHPGEFNIFLGDRNSNFDHASAQVLEGSLRLDDFQRNGKCKISEYGLPLCDKGAQDPPILRSLLFTDPTKRKFEGTHKYRGKYTWLDDIILPISWEKKLSVKNSLKSGMEFEPYAASDHALIYASFLME